MSYDSANDTYSHKRHVESAMGKIIKALEDRSEHHDDSKLENPEKACYDKYIPLLKETKYGTKEYYAIKDAMENDGLKHHFDANRHHPEHFKNGIEDMTLVDIVEMFCDHYAASLRSDTGYPAGEKSNAGRYHYPDALLKIFMNTYDEYFK